MMCSVMVKETPRVKTPRVSVVLTADEKKKIRSGLPRGVSDSNAIRARLNLDPMAHGGARNGKSRVARAKKNGK